MPDIVFDHIAIGMARMADAAAFLAGGLGGRPDTGGPGPGFRWACWRYEGGGRIEVIEPAGADGFLHRFLARRGPGVHHVTFKVASLAAAVRRAERQGARVVGYDDSDPRWMTAYLHPAEAMGIVVQLGQAAGGDDPRPWAVPDAPPPAGNALPPRVAVVGLRLRARDFERADRQWAAILGGEAARDAGDAPRVYRWPGSPMRIAVELDPAGVEGAVAIEVECARPLGLPAGPVEPLGTVFRQTAGIPAAGGPASRAGARLTREGGVTWPTG